MIAAPVHLPPVAFFTAILFIALGAGASGALNMWWDADIDALMKRTARRPIPAGMIAPGEALGFGMALSVGSVIMLWLATNWVAAALLAASARPALTAIPLLLGAPVGLSWLKLQARLRRDGRLDRLPASAAAVSSAPAPPASPESSG